MTRKFLFFAFVFCLCVFVHLGGGEALAASANYYDEGHTGDTEEDAYIIDSVEDMISIQNHNDAYVRKYYKLANDLELPYTGHSIGLTVDFEGCFDGQGHTIKINRWLFFYLNAPSSSDVSIKNLKVEGIMSEDWKAGPIAVELKQGIIENCTFSGDIEGIATNSAPSPNVGGIVGVVSKNGTVKNCTVYGTVATTSPNGGFGGVSGGIVGSLSGGIVDNCTIMPNSKVLASGYAGGIIGEADSGYVKNCTSNAIISGDVYSGGIIGYSKATENANNTFTRTELAIGNDNNSAKYKITVTSPDTKLVTLSSIGGSFSNVIVSSDGTPDGNVTWEISADSNLTVNITPDGNNAVVSGIVPANSSTTSIQLYNITVIAKASYDVNYKTSFDVSVSSKTFDEIGITITSPDSKVINIPASGGTFDNVIVTIKEDISNSTAFGLGIDGEIIDNPSSETNIGEVSEIDSYTPTDDKRIVYIKGRAAPNYSGTQTTTRITVSFIKNGITYSTSFDVVVASALSASGYNTRAWRYQFSMPSQLASTIASIFGVNSSQIFQLTDSEILDENWTLEAGDSSSISNMGETVAINIPSVMPSNTGVYVMRYALDSSLAGKNLKVRGVADSNSSSSLSTSAVEDREYVFFDANYNEITSVPSDGIVYVAQRMTSGQANKGVITTSDELSVGLIKPIEEASRDILREKISEIKSVRTEEVLFIEEENIYPAQEPPAIVIEQSKNDNANILAKFNTLSVDLSGLYVFHVILSDDVAREIESVDIDQLRIYAAEFESTGVFPAVYQASDGQVKTAFLYGLLNTFELLTMGGEKLKFGAKEFLMVGFLNASKPLSLYIGKILLALLMGGCNSGFGVTVLALIIGGVFISQKKKRRSLS